jgi:hypothetical protein
MAARYRSHHVQLLVFDLLSLRAQVKDWLADIQFMSVIEHQLARASRMPVSWLDKSRQLALTSSDSPKPL